MSGAVGFLGLGEAGRALGRELVDAGGAVVGYDVAFDDPERGPGLRATVRAAGIETAEGPEVLAATAPTVLSTVVPSAAVDAARSIAAHLDPGHLLVDLNSVSPGQKARIRAVVEEGEGRFVEGAIMGSVPKHGRRVPMLLCGPRAREAEARLSELGLRPEVLGEGFGAAAATKMCRSLVIKGLECLLAECLATAREHGVAERVLDSLDASLPGVDWSGRADYALGRMALHAGRRSHEMEEVARTVAELGIEPEMARASVAWFRRVAALALAGRFPDGPPEGFEEVLTAMEEASRG